MSIRSLASRAAWAARGALGKQGPRPFPVDAWADEGFGAWFEAHKATQEELERQRAAARRSEGPVFSIVVPLYKTPADYLADMADSVLAQTYPRFELVLVNASPEIEELSAGVAAYADQDPRVRVVTLDANHGISENTKRGIEAATGDFVGFLDHDDLIEPDLLFRYAEAVAERPETDVLYCDEDLVEGGERGFAHKCPRFKPDFAPELLLCKNYAIHMLTVRREILLGMPGLDSLVDGAQDFAMLSHAVREARAVCHVPRILYHWRISGTSTALNPHVKPYSELATRSIISREYERRGMDASIVTDAIPRLYVPWFSATSGPRVSLVVRCRPKGTAPAVWAGLLAQTVAYEGLELVFVVPKGTAEEAEAALAEATRDAKAGFDVRVVEACSPAVLPCLDQGASQATGKYVIFMDDSCTFLSAQPVSQLVGLSEASGVGVVAPKTLYRDGTCRAFGIGITPERIMPLYRGYPDEFPAYDCALRTLANVSAASWRGMCVDRELFGAVGGFDESFADEVGSADLCVRIRHEGLRVVQTPTVRVRVDEPAPADPFGDNAPDFGRIDVARFDAKWLGLRAAGDPYLNPNLDQSSEYFQLPLPWSRALR